MQITFKINYHTEWGQRIAVIGDLPELGADDPDQPFFLYHTGNGYWENTLALKRNISEFNYKYILLNDYAELLDEDWGDKRSITTSGKDCENLILQDTWRARHHPENPLYSAAFLDVIFKPGQYRAKATRSAKGKARLTFQLHAPRLETHQQICLSGNIPELGLWDLNKPLLLGNAQHPLWSGSIQVKPDHAIEYKYGIYDTNKKKIEFLEAGVNRIFHFEEEANVHPEVIITNEYFKYPKGNWKGAGVAMPVFSLRTKKSFGVGEFTDIKLLVDWSEQVGLRLVQILPINDTIATYTWVDSYPYAAISVFALHPIYLNLEAIKGFRGAVDEKNYRKGQKKLNALPKVDYEAVLNSKLKYARQIFLKEKTAFLKSAGFRKFMKENQHWLKPYALFCYLRDKNQTVNFNEWKTGSKFSKSLLTKLTGPKAAHFDEIAFYYFLQYHLDKQLREAADYARSKGIVLKGDIPIGIYRYSVDAWVAPELYNMNGQSGAPPDPFSEIGQNWGFPTYNWEVMAKNGYQWWQNRLQQLSYYFDAFRIDHILGFFRIWEIPLEQIEGTFGFFNKAIPIARHEFADRGITFDYDRYCTPYLPEHVIQQSFGADAPYVKKTFLKKSKSGQYQFKTEFDTQRKVKTWFDKEAPKGKGKLKDPLFKLLSNVLFFEVPGSNGEAYHPRIDFLKISSFLELDDDTRHRLEDLYNDYFYHRQEDFWREEALRKLPAIKRATNMLICGEDLGMVPACVPGVMHDLGFLTLEIQRMSKNPQTEFLQSADIPYWSVCSPSTHDMSPLRLWWEECDEGQRQRFYNQELGQSGIAPAGLEPYLAQGILQQHLNYPGMWVVFPMQDILAISWELRSSDPAEERINVPANPQHYWRYRLHLTLEDLIAANDFNVGFGKLVGGR